LGPAAIFELRRQPAEAIRGEDWNGAATALADGLALARISSAFEKRRRAALAAAV